MNIKVMVATHKYYEMPEDKMYTPILVGAVTNWNKLDKQNAAKISKYIRDDSGDNISSKNPFYCELTALYWGWKQLKADFVGLVHYRRHFMNTSGKFAWNNILSTCKAEELFSKGYEAIVPKKRHYVIETIQSHYEHTHHKEDLEVTKAVIEQYYPEYKESYETVMNRRSAHMFNMCIMKKELLDSYCKWLFDILGKVEEGLDISNYSDFDKRVFGRISELLLDVWMKKHDVKYTEMPVRNPEGEQLVSKVIKVIKTKFAR